LSEFEDNVFDHMELQKRLMEVCGVYDLSINEQLEVTLLNIAGESIEAMGFVLDRTKPWKISYFDVDEVREEVIDVYHFFLQFLVVADLYDKFANFSYGEILVQSDKIECMKSDLKNSGEEALKFSRWYLPGELEQFTFRQWERMLAIFYALDMTPEDVDRIYREKNARNFERIKEKLDAIN